MAPAEHHLAIRVDASRDIGTGHAMRCLALADALRRRGGQACFLSRHMPAHLRELIEAHGHEALCLKQHDSTVAAGTGYQAWLGTTESADAHASIEALGGRSWDAIVVDHYALGAAWETALRPACRRLMAVDDLADRMHDCDLLLDQNFCGAGDHGYGRLVPVHCRLLLGPRYALLRDEFRALHARAGTRDGKVGRVLVFMGGIDAGDYTSQAIEALSALGRDDLEVDVVIGQLHAKRDQIRDACNARGYRCHIQTSELADHFANADLAVGSGGSATWERCSVGLPTLTIQVADNQKRLIESAAMRGLLYSPALRPGGAVAIGHHLRALLDNPVLLRSISTNGLQNVDGHGTDRVLRALVSRAIEVREATAADAADVLAWRNHPTVRAVSRNQEIIAADAHAAWFAAAVKDPDRVILVGEKSGQAVGVARFDMQDAIAHISIFMAPQLAGQGLGSGLLAAAEAWLRRSRTGVQTIEAQVLGDNEASHALFRSGGYERQSTSYVKRLQGT